MSCNLLKCILLLSVLVTGCSKIQVAYDFAPRIIAGKVDDYFDLSSKQKTELKETLKQELDRIVIEKLPVYMELENEWVRYIEKKNLEKKELKTHLESTRAWMLDLFASMEPSLLPHAMKLTQAQIDYFYRKAQEDILEVEEKTATPEKQKKYLKKRFEFGIDWNFDGLTSAEKELFDAWLADSPYPFVEELRNRRESIAAFKNAFQSPDTFRSHLEKLFRKPLSMRRKEYAVAMDRFFESYVELQWKILIQATDKDRKKRAEYIRDRIQQFTELRDKVIKKRNNQNN